MDFAVNCSTFFYKHLFQIYLNDLICTKIPKPQTVELGDNDFFIDPKLFVIAKVFPQSSSAVFGVNCYFSH
jgi:hypothetical protein